MPYPYGIFDDAPGNHLPWRPVQGTLNLLTIVLAGD